MAIPTGRASISQTLIFKLMRSLSVIFLQPLCQSTTCGAHTSLMSPSVETA